MRLLNRKLIRDLGRQRPQVIAIIVTMILGIALFGASYDAYRNLTASYDRMFRETAFADLWIIGGDQQAIATEVADTPGVDAVTTRSSADIPMRLGADGHQLLGRLIGMPADHQPAVNQVLVLDGTYLAPDAPNGVLLERHAADHFGLGPGDQIEVTGASGSVTLVIRGVVSSAEYLWPARSRQDPLTSQDDFAVVFVPESMVASLAPQQATPETLVRYTPSVTDSTTTAHVVSVATGNGAADWYTRTEQPSNALLGEDIRGFGELSVMFPLLFISATMMATYLLLSRLVRAQQGQIGTLRAAGVGRRMLLTHYVGFGFLPGLAGGLLGAGIGAALARVVTDVYTSQIDIPLRVHAVHPDTIAIGVTLGLAGGSLAAVPAAWAAMRIEPAEAMRGVRPAGRGGLSAWERIIPPLRALPVRWRTVLRNLGRQRRRTAYTASGVVLALILVLVSWGMIDTVQVLLTRQFDRVQRWDASLYLMEPASDAEVAALRSVAGVDAAESIATIQVALATTHGSYSTDLDVYDQATVMHDFLGPGGQPETLPDRGLLVGAALRDLLGVDVGSSVSVTVPSTGASTTTTIAGFVEEPLGTFAYASFAELDALFPGSALPPGARNTVLVQFSPSEPRAAIIDTLSSRPEVAAVSDGRSLFDTAQSLMSFFYAFVGVMLLFGGLMAGALVFNTVSANVAERSAEIASLRAAGMDAGTLRRLIGVENLLVAAIGVPIGLVAGYFVARTFMGAFSSDLFQFDLSMRPTTFVFAALGVLLLSGLAELPALRAAGRVDIASVLRQPGL